MKYRPIVSLVYICSVSSLLSLPHEINKVTYPAQNRSKFEDPKNVDFSSTLPMSADNKRRVLLLLLNMRYSGDVYLSLWSFSFGSLLTFSDDSVKI